MRYHTTSKSTGIQSTTIQSNSCKTRTGLNFLRHSATRLFLIGTFSVIGLAACSAQNAEATDTKNTEPASLYQDQAATPAAPSTGQATQTAQAQVAAFTPSPERGAKLFRQCRSCHTVDKDGRNRIGPNLYNIYGASAGKRDGFKYSKAMLAASIIWDEESLNGYLEKPSRFLPKTRMSFGGIKDPNKRADMIAYLKTLQD